MNALPIVRRELLLLSRRRWFYWLRSGVGVAIVIVSCVTFTISSNATTFQDLGAPLFTTITLMSYCICLLAGPVLLADSIAEERTAGTLGLLFLTNTRSPDIVGGKFIAMAMPALHCLLATLPVLAIAFFLGGVSGGEFLRTTGALLNVLLLSLASAALCSVLASSGRRAFGAAMLAMLICGGVLPVLLVLKPLPALGDWWLLETLASPGLALWTASDVHLKPNPAAYSTALIAGQIMGWTCLAAAMLALPYRWQDKSERGTGEKRTLIPAAKYRSSRKRGILPKRDPVTWLARQRLGGTLPAWVMTAVTAGILAWLTQAALKGQVNGLTVAFAAYALHGVFKVWVGWVASRAFGPERDSGALELLLITPLGETVIWRAWMAGLRRRFLIPALVLIAADLLIAWLAAIHADDGAMRMSLFFLSLPFGLIFLLDCHALSWSGLWNGLIARNATRACIRSMLPVLVIPGIVFTTLFFGTALAGVLNDELAMMLLVVWFVVSFALDMIFSVLSMTRLSHDCREAVVRSRSGN